MDIQEKLVLSLLKAILPLILLHFCCGSLPAEPITESEAENVVIGWLIADKQPLGTNLGQKIKSIDAFTDSNDEPVYYIVYLDPNGFVIVSADDMVQPIIGFASSGTYNPSEDNPLGTLVGRDLPHRINEVRLVQKYKISGDEKNQTVQHENRRAHFQKMKNKWDLLQGYSQAKTQKKIIAPSKQDMVSGDEPNEAFQAGSYGAPGSLSYLSDVRVAPLVQSKWGQSSVYGYGEDCYNYYTPNNYICGCVATMLAQLIRFYQYPADGIGYHPFTITVDGSYKTVYTRGGDGSGGPYDWDSMVYEPDYDTTLTQRQAIGALCYDAGVASHTSYTSEWTAAYMDDARDALLNTFGYSNAILAWNGNSNIGPGLNGILNTNLDAGYPVSLGVISSDIYGGGHAVICDGYGYDGSTLYHHLNMGWEGYEDAWYNLPDIGTEGEFDIVDLCIYNIFTSGSGEIISGRVTDMAGNPISDAAVTTNGCDSVVTDEQGIYALTNAASQSTYTISVAKTGYYFTHQHATTGLSVNNRSSSGNCWGINFQRTGADDFDDNNQATMWQLYENDSDNCWLEETSERLEIRSTSDADDFAKYLSNWWGLDVASDFSFKIDFHYDKLTSENGYVLIGISPTMTNSDDKSVYFMAGCDQNSSYFYYVAADGSLELNSQAERSDTDGTLYVSYDTAKDELYLSNTGYGDVNAWQTISGFLRGRWLSETVYIKIGGGSEHAALDSGDAYLDNFIIESGTFVESSPPSRPIVSISAIDSQAAETVTGETANPGTFRISRFGNTANSLTVYFTRSGTAAFGAAGDYTLNGNGLSATAASVVIPAGSVHVDIKLTAVDNLLYELSEKAILTLAANAAYTLDPIVSQRTATVTILDNEPTINITAIDNQAAEAAMGETNNPGVFRISRITGNTANDLIVYFTRSGTAIFGAAGDYTFNVNGTPLTATSVVIPKDQNYVDITVTPVDNLLCEPTEKVTLALVAKTAYNLTSTLAERTATVNILDNEPTVSVLAADNQASEDGNTAIFRINRTGSTINPVTVYFTRSGTAIFGATGDYTLDVNGTPLTAASVVIPKDQNHVDITVTPVDNLLIEPTERIILTLAAKTTYNLTSTLAERTATVTILDNEPTINITAIDNQAAESAVGEANNPGVFRISRISGSIANDLTVYFTRSGTAIFGATGDYTLDVNGTPLTATSVVIPKDQNYVDITIRSVDNLLVEPTEKVTLTLVAKTTYNRTATLTERTATVTILDNEPTINIIALDNQAAETAVGEANNPGVFRISRIAGSDANDLTVYFTRASTATYTTDYTLSGNGLSATATSAVIPAGQDYVDITVNPVNNLLVEPIERIILTLAAKTTYNRTATLSERTATVTIIDDDM